MIRIPQQGKFSQPNKGEIFGNLYRTQNIDLKTNPGKIRVSPRTIVNTKDNDSPITGMGVPLGFVRHDGGGGYRYYAVTGIGGNGAAGTGKVFISASDSPSATFSNDATTNTPTDVHADYSDVVKWTDGSSGTLGDSIFVSTTSTGAGVSNIKKLYATVDGWNATWFTGTVAGSLLSGVPNNLCPAFNGNLYISNFDRVYYVPFSTSGSAVNSVLSGPGTLNFYGRYYVIWMRSTSDNVWLGLMTLDGKGYVAKWDTTGTAPQAVYDIQAPCAPSATVLDNALYTIDAFGRLKKFNGTGFEEIARLPVANQNIEMPGIYSVRTNSRWIHQRGMDVVDGKINILVNNFVSTGVYVEDMPSGIWEYDPEIGLYHKSSPCADTNDYGQQSILTAGALCGTKRTTATFLAGVGYYTDSGSTSRKAIFYDDVAHTTARRGLITLPWISSTQINDTFHKVIYRFRQLVSGSKIIGKFRNAKNANLPFVAAITWTSTTTLTSVDGNFQYASVGDEVEVTQGKGASTTAHISAISAAAGTYTVTLEDAIGFSSGTALAKVNNYRKMGEISQLLTGSGILTMNTADTGVQIKAEFRDEGGLEINDQTITSAPQKLAN